MKLPAADRMFDEVCKYNKLLPDEIALYAQAYRNDPEAGRITCQALHNEFNNQWRFEMNKGINERIKNDFARLKELLLAKKAAVAGLGPQEAGGPSQPGKPVRPPPPADPREPQQPVREDPPDDREAA